MDQSGGTEAFESPAANNKGRRECEWQRRATLGFWQHTASNSSVSAPVDNMLCMPLRM